MATTGTSGGASHLRPEIQPAVLLSSTAHQLPGKLLVTELFFQVPLDHATPNGEKLRIFCRSARKFEKPAASKPKGDDDDKLPWFVYVPGGPGFGCPPPESLQFTSEVLDRGYQLLCFDHRGMGLSTPATAATITARGSPEDQARYLRHFRADNAVRDLEAIRKCLAGAEKWSIMGTSYGGFVCLNYLSYYPEGLREAFPVAGMAPITQAVPDRAIEKLFHKVVERNQIYYAKYPEDEQNVRKIVGWITNTEPFLPCGDLLTAGRFLEMGIVLGFHRGLDQIHGVVLRAANDIDTVGVLTRPTLSIIQNMSAFADHPLYAVLHTSIYVQGRANASDWVFDRTLTKFPQFTPNTDDQNPIFFTGEMVFRRAFDDYEELKPLLAATELLEKSGWDGLYDLEQLRRNDVPVYAAIFVDDMYVDFDFSRETASLVQGCKTFISNLLYHDAMRAGKCEDVLKALFALRDDTID